MKSLTFGSIGPILPRGEWTGTTVEWQMTFA